MPALPENPKKQTQVFEFDDDKNAHQAQMWATHPSNYDREENAKADYIRTHEFKTIVGDVSFGKDGEWSKSREIEVQWQNISGGGLEPFKDAKTEVILYPPEYKDGELEAPFAK